MRRRGDGDQSFPLLDSIRALAAISILVVHTSFFSGAYRDAGLGRFLAHLDVGVPVFFVLSGFLLYRPFVAARVSGRPRLGFGEYGKRRLVRIVPAYWVVLTIAAIVPGVAGVFSGNWWAYYGLLQPLPVYTATADCATDVLRCGLPVTWSLTVEVIFYATLPLWVLAVDRLSRHWRRSPLGLDLALLAVLVAISIVILASSPGSDLYQFLLFSPLGRGCWFAVGMALATLRVWLDGSEREPAAIRLIGRRPGVPIVLAAATYVFAVAVVLRPLPLLRPPLDEPWRFVAENALFALVAGLVVLPAIFGLRAGGFSRRALAQRPLLWLGMVSYGIFLWHYPVVLGLVNHGINGFVELTALTLALTIPCAAASYYVIERPLMRAVRSRPGAGGAALGSAELEEEKALHPGSYA